MTESPLDAIRRQLREAEEKLKHSPAAEGSGPALRTDESEPASIAEAAGFSATGIPASQETHPPLPAYLRALLDSSKDSFILVDEHAGWQLANRKLPAWLGYSREDFQKIDLMEIFEADDAKRLLALFPKWFIGEEPIRQLSISLRSRTGDRVPVMLSSHAWANEQNERFAFLVLEDLRARRNLETEIATTRAFIDAMMRGGSIPIFLMRTDGVILDVNSAAGRWLGKEDEKLLNTALRDYIDAGSHTSFDIVLARATRLQPSADIHCRFRRASGAEFDARLFMVGISDAKGHISRVIGTLERSAGEESSDPVTIWSAFGLMTPGRLQELSGIIGTSVREFLDQLRARVPLPPAESAVPRLVQIIDRARATMGAWIESTEFLKHPANELRFGDLIEQAIEARRPELARWGIEATLQVSEGAAEVICPYKLILPVLHILQVCIEELHDFSGGGRLTIRGQCTADRLEATFLYNQVLPDAGGAGKEVEYLASEVRFSNVELRVAQKILDVMGGNLVLENVSESQRAIRMTMSLAAMADDSHTMEKGVTS